MGAALIEQTGVIPFTNRVVEHTAQQAMAHLYYSLTHSQLSRMFEGDRAAAGACMSLLDQPGFVGITKPHGDCAPPGIPLVRRAHRRTLLAECSGAQIDRLGARYHQILMIQWT